MLEDPVPSGVSFEGVESSQGHCTITRELRCALGTVVAGGGALVKVTPTVAADAIGGIVNASTVWANRGEADEANVTAISVVHVTPSPTEPAEPTEPTEPPTEPTGPGDPPPGPGAQPVSDLVLRKQVDHRVAFVGQRLRYTLTITNQGPDRATIVTLKDTPKLPVRLVSIHPSQGSCRTGPPLTCSLGTLRPGARITIAIIVLPMVVGTQTNAAAAISASRNRHPQTSLATATTRIIAPPKPPARPPFTGETEHGTGIRRASFPPGTGLSRTPTASIATHAHSASSAKVSVQRERLAQSDANPVRRQHHRRGDRRRSASRGSRKEERPPRSARCLPPSALHAGRHQPSSSTPYPHEQR